MATNRDGIDRAAIAADLERARVEFHRLIDAAGPRDWRRPTRGTRWNNEQLLFHMLFGYLVVHRLLRIVRIFGRLPDRAGVTFAGILDAATTPFHAINYWGSCAGALLYDRHRMGAKLDRVIVALERHLAGECDSALRRGMHFPTRWDPFFDDYMTLEEVYRYAGRHFDFHSRQLTLTAD